MISGIYVILTILWYVLSSYITAWSAITLFSQLWVVTIVLSNEFDELDKTSYITSNITSVITHVITPSSEVFSDDLGNDAKKFTSETNDRHLYNDHVKIDSLSFVR